jgi:dolichol kinase
MLRKVWHLLGLAFPVCYYLGVVSRETVLVAAGAATLILTVLEAVRFGHPWVARTFVAVFGGLLREEEKSLVNGSFIYLFAVFVAVLAFPKTLACVAVVYLAVGDAAAWLVGKHLGRVKIGRYKTLEGSLACFGACFLVGWAVWPWPLALAGAGAAAVIELFSPGQSDNFTLPLGAGAVVWFVSRITRLPIT